MIWYVVTIGGMPHKVFADETRLNVWLVHQRKNIRHHLRVVPVIPAQEETRERP